MSVRLYLKSRIKDDPRCTKDRSWRFGDIALNVDKDRLFIDASRTGDCTVLGPLREYVDEVSVIEQLPLEPKRERGIYSVGGTAAYASVSLQIVSNGSERYEVHVTAPDVAQANVLLEHIKVGDIRPKVSHDGKQGGKSHAELENENLQLTGKLVWEEACSDVLRGGVQELVDELLKRPLRLQSPKTMAQKLTKILEAKPLPGNLSECD